MAETDRTTAHILLMENLPCPACHLPSLPLHAMSLPAPVGSMPLSSPALQRRNLGEPEGQVSCVEQQCAAGAAYNLIQVKLP
eukprot:748274-Hanusia_phi.AAC.6